MCPCNSEQGARPARRPLGLLCSSTFNVRTMVLHGVYSPKTVMRSACAPDSLRDDKEHYARFNPARRGGSNAPFAHENKFSLILFHSVACRNPGERCNADMVI